MTPSDCSVSLIQPLRPSKGIHEIMRITLEVQNGIVITVKITVCAARLGTWKATK